MRVNVVWLVKILIIILDRWKNSRFLLDNEIRNYRKKRAILMAHIVMLQSQQAQLLMSIIGDDDDSDDDKDEDAVKEPPAKKCWAIERPKTFWEVKCQHLSDAEFKSIFRMHRRSFDALCELLRTNLKKTNTKMRTAISLEKRVAVPLLFLGCNKSFRNIAEIFGIGVATVCCMTEDFINVVWRNMFTDALPLNTKTIREHVKEFEELGFPQCLGIVGGCHIEICPNSEALKDFFNENNYFSTILLALIDANGRFSHLSVGWPGKYKIATIYEQSPLSEQLENCDLLKKMSKTIKNQKVPVFVLGDSSFPFSGILMKPYSEDEIKTKQQKNFNQMATLNHHIAENAFTQLKARFKRIGNGVENSIEKTFMIIKACCALHNFLSDQHDEVEPQWLEEIERSDDVDQEAYDESTRKGANDEAEKIRHALGLYFSNMH